MSRQRSILEDPVTSTEVAVTEPDKPAGSACPRCGAPLRADQDWCLNCGTAVTTHVAGASGWRAPAAIAAALLVIALAGLVAAFLAVSNDPDETAQVAPSAAQQVLPPAPTPAPTAGATPEPDPITPGTIPPATDGDPGATTDGGSSSAGSGSGSGSSGSSTAGTWPAGRTAWTVILVSSTTRARADRRAKDLKAGGTDVGVLKSDDFKSLRGGYYVVFSGQYAARGAAEDALAGLRSKAPEAYVRRVTPR